MSKSFTYGSYKKEFQSVTEVMDHMLELQKELESTQLQHLNFFNYTYYIITKNVYAKIGTGYFTHDATISNLDIIFAKYYFDPLQAYSKGKQTTPAWQVAFDAYKENNSLPLIYLALGVNAHVNNDLGLALFDTLKNENFKDDYHKVNKIIYDSLDEVIAELKLSRIYKPFMNILIKHWRNKAWRNFELMNKDVKNKLNIENNAYEIATALAKIHSMSEFYRLYKVI